MKRIITMLLCVCLLCSSTLCFAEDPISGVDGEVVTVTQNNGTYATASNLATEQPILTNVEYTQEGGRNLIAKTYEVPVNFDVQKLAEADFQDRGMLYTHRDTVKIRDNQTEETKQASQMVSIDHEEKSGAMSKLQPMIDYEQDGYSGQLLLQSDSITMVEAGHESYSYTISDTREYPNLDRNDMAYIPKTAEKNGVLLNLTGVDWQVVGNGTFTANAAYTGRDYGNKVTGYTSQALYSGEVRRVTLDGSIYEVIYEGRALPIPYMKYIAAAGVAAAIAALLIVLWKRRRNAKIYALLDGEFRIVRRVRVSYIDPIVDITPSAVQSRSSEYIITLDRWSTKQLHNQRLRILCADGTVREQTIIDTGRSYKIHLEAMPVPCSNEDDSDNEV